MVKIRSLYHTPKGERGIGKWIVGWTWFLALFYNWKVLKYNYSHEELWFPEKNGYFDYEKIERRHSDNDIEVVGTGYLGQCFSSTTRGDDDGVRFAPASKVLKHPERWEYIEFEVTDFQYKHMLALAESRVGNKYDFVAITTGFMTPIMFDPKDKDYCSGVCCLVKFVGGILTRIYKRISPRRSAYIMAKKFGEPKPI